MVLFKTSSPHSKLDLVSISSSKHICFTLSFEVCLKDSICFFSFSLSDTILKSVIKSSSSFVFFFFVFLLPSLNSQFSAVPVLISAFV